MVEPAREISSRTGRRFKTRAYVIVDINKDIVGVRLTKAAAERLRDAVAGSTIKKFDATK